MKSMASETINHAAQHILLVDDDAELCDMIAEYLGERGFVVDIENDGPGGLERAQQNSPALVILDVMLPEMDGLEVLRRLRASGVSTPVVILTAQGGEVDRIVGLELGADDYLPKPFNPRELLARIRAVLRRANTEPNAGVKAGVLPPSPAASDQRLCVGEVELDAAARTARCAGQELELTATEFDLLHALLRAAGRVLTRQELAREALGRRLLPLDRSLDIHICKLRHKLWPDERGLERIKTVRGVGYIFVWDE
jgi:two-component system response regulator CpxR